VKDAYVNARQLTAAQLPLSPLALLRRLPSTLALCNSPVPQNASSCSANQPACLALPPTGTAMPTPYTLTQPTEFFLVHQTLEPPMEGSELRRTSKIQQIHAEGAILCAHCSLRHPTSHPSSTVRS